MIVYSQNYGSVATVNLLIIGYLLLLDHLLDALVTISLTVNLLVISYLLFSTLKFSFKFNTISLLYFSHPLLSMIVY